MNAITDLLGVLVTAFALGFAGYQFMRGVQQYRVEQSWRRKEYAAREYDRLINDSKAGLALLMLDWDARLLPLLADADGKPILVKIDRIMLGRALIPHAVAGRPSWGREEGAIRDCMDALLERLGTFEIMIAEGLIAEADIAPYLSYWVALIGDPQSRSWPPTICNLWLYIESYDFDRAASFVERFGYEIKPADGDWAALEKECAAGIWSRPAREASAAPGTGNSPL